MTQDISYLDVTGYTLGEARVYLKNANFVISRINITSPPRKRYMEYKDTYRVLRVGFDENGNIELLVCAPDEE